MIIHADSHHITPEHPSSPIPLDLRSISAERLIVGFHLIETGCGADCQEAHAQVGMHCEWSACLLVLRGSSVHSSAIRLESPPMSFCSRLKTNTIFFPFHALHCWGMHVVICCDMHIMPVQNEKSHHAILMRIYILKIKQNTTKIHNFPHLCARSFGSLSVTPDRWPPCRTRPPIISFNPRYCEVAWAQSSFVHCFVEFVLVLPQQSEIDIFMLHLWKCSEFQESKLRIGAWIVNARGEKAENRHWDFDNPVWAFWLFDRRVTSLQRRPTG